MQGGTRRGDRRLSTPFALSAIRFGCRLNKAGGLRSAASLAQSQYVLNGDNTATSVVMSGATVTTLAGTSVGGRPTTDAAGISVAMPDPDGFSVTYSATTAVYVPTGIPATNTNCRATYTATSTTDPVVVDISNC